ncbi:putative E3 ubiquitin-protein ligase RING1a isoform X2 [Hibiscus syriacus]|uniref:putative E3 ubiquitin-protein ligase RING1a isoform X2 n=1 Tax=Hibiscus syriacus TaxID=106335 RepID=UPI0019204747|nr:putative E3 ubiquitin-protein ligase RING1a isoform X2 [Hibiscus syriacus]
MKKTPVCITKATPSNLGTKMANSKKLRLTQPKWRNNSPSRNKNRSNRNKTPMNKTNKLNNSKPKKKMKMAMGMEKTKMILMGANLLLLKRNPRIIKKTRTVMECLHRFCRECIDKSMRLGNNECPACRTHCASRRSLRDDPNYDALIAALYPDIDKYEEQELAFHEEERTRNKQIQASIAQVLQRQSEALVKRRSLRKESSAGGFITRSQRHHLSSHPRRRRNSSGAEHQGSEDNENDDNGGKDSSSTDERCTEVRQRRRKRRTGIRMSLPSSSAVNSDGGYVQNDAEVSRDCRGISPGLVWNPDLLAWGRGGARSHTRHGNSGSGSSKSSRARLNRLVEYLRSLEENDAELDVHLKLISVDEHSTSSLHQPYLCCRPSLSVKQLYEYIALQTPLRAEEVEILMVKGPYRTNENCANLSEDALQVLEGQETLAGLKVKRTSGMNHLILAYRQRQSS